MLLDWIAAYIDWFQHNTGWAWPFFATLTTLVILWLLIQLAHGMAALGHAFANGWRNPSHPSPPD